MVGKRQFGLRSLFLCIAVFAISLWAWRRIHDWYFTVPLANAIESFNSRIQNDSVRSLEKQLTEDEIINAIRSQLSGFPASTNVKAIYAQVARTRRLPRDATISPVKSYSVTPEGPRWHSMIQLDVVTHDKKHCSFPIRLTGDSTRPALVRQDKNSP